VVVVVAVAVVVSVMAWHNNNLNMARTGQPENEVAHGIKSSRAAKKDK